MLNHAEFQKKYGPWAVVAGASEGLGAAYASQLAGRGLNLFLVARRAELIAALAEKLASTYGVQVRTLPLDLSGPDAAERIHQETAGLDTGLLIYNAAFSAVGPFTGRPLEDHLREIDTNIRTPLALVYRMGQRMLEKGHGGVVLMSSLSAFQGSAYISNYAASKAFSLLLAEGLWEEWRGRGVDVLVCVGGSIRTPNAVASAAQNNTGMPAGTLEPDVVAREALSALGRQPLVIPGRGNRLASFFMHRLLPRRAAVRLMGRVLRGMYARE